MALPSQKYQNPKRTITGTSNTIFPDDVVILCDTSSGAVSLTLQAIPNDYWSTQYTLYVVDSGNNATTNNITINAPSGQTINGASSFVINTSGASVVVSIVANNKYIGQYSVTAGGTPATAPIIVKDLATFQSEQASNSLQVDYWYYITNVWTDPIWGYGWSVLVRCVLNNRISKEAFAIWNAGIIPTPSSPEYYISVTLFSNTDPSLGMVINECVGDAMKITATQANTYNTASPSIKYLREDIPVVVELNDVSTSSNGLFQAFLNNTGLTIQGFGTSLSTSKSYTLNYATNQATPISYYDTIQNEGSALTQRTIIDFVGDGVTATDDVANQKTIVTIPNGSGTWQNIPYDDGDTTNAPGCNGRYLSSAGGGTGGGASFAEWFAYKGTSGTWNTSTPSARRLKYRINGDNSCQIMGQIIRTITPIAGNIDLGNSAFLYNVSTFSFISFDSNILLNYPINIPSLTSGTDLLKFIPCILYVFVEGALNLTNFGTASKLASFPCQCILYQPSAGVGYIQFYVTGGALATLTGLVGSHALMIVINTTFSIQYNN
jgi:hypothetical protein